MKTVVLLVSLLCHSVTGFTGGIGATFQDVVKGIDYTKERLDQALQRADGFDACGKEVVMPNWKSGSQKVEIVEAKFVRCRSLMLYNVDLSANVVPLADAIIKLGYHLREISLTNNNLVDRDFSEIALALAQHKKLTKFEYAKNNLAASASKLEEVVESNSDLETLFVDWTHFPYGMVRSLAQVLASSKLAHLTVWMDPLVAEQQQAANVNALPLLEELKGCDTLQSLDISGNRISSSRTQRAVAALLNANDNLASLNLAFCGIEPGEVVLANALASSSLSHLSLSNNPLGGDFLHALLKHLQSNFKLTSLEMDGTGLEEAGKQLADMLWKNKGLKYLDVTENMLNSANTKQLLVMVGASKGLETLQLGNSMCADSDCWEILAEMFRSNQQLGVLNLDSFTFPHDEDIADLVPYSRFHVLVDGVLDNTHLEVLTMGHLNLGNRRGEACIRLLHSKSLKHLRLDFNDFADEHAPLLQAAVANNSALLSLDLSGNTFTEVGLRLILQGVAANRHLRTLKLEHNPVEAAAEAVIWFVQQSSPLRHLFLGTEGKFRLTPGQIDRLLEAMASNSYLQTLTLSNDIMQTHEILGKEQTEKLDALLMRNTQTFALPTAPDAAAAAAAGEKGTGTGTGTGDLSQKEETINEMQKIIAKLQAELSAAKAAEQYAKAEALLAKSETAESTEKDGRAKAGRGGRCEGVGSAEGQCSDRSHGGNGGGGGDAGGGGGGGSGGDEEESLQQYRLNSASGHTEETSGVDSYLEEEKEEQEERGGRVEEITEIAEVTGVGNQGAKGATGPKGKDDEEAAQGASAEQQKLKQEL